MIETAKEAKALGCSWVKILVRHADGARFELEGAFTRADANAIVADATNRPEPGARVKCRAK